MLCAAVANANADELVDCFFVISQIASVKMTDHTTKTLHKFLHFNYFKSNGGTPVEAGEGICCAV